MDAHSIALPISRILIQGPRRDFGSPLLFRNQSFSSIKPSFHSSILSVSLTSSTSKRVHCFATPEEGTHVEEPNDVVKGSFKENQTIWQQMKEIAMFTGPATGLWICGPLMSLIDTAFIGHRSSTELAALGPGTVICDMLSYVFMFISIATSNMVATSLAKKDKEGVQHQLSVMLFIGLTCGTLMLVFTKLFSFSLLNAFTGSNLQIVPAANKYAQIRALAWPAILIGWVAQSASLGMKDSWGPLKALVVSSAINGLGDFVLCWCFNYGIAGAAWATMVSQIVAAYMMLNSLQEKGYSAYSISIPSRSDLATIFGLAAPVFVMIMSKVAFYTMVVYFATSLGTITLAAHQVMIQAFFLCSICGEPLSQTAQSFMPELLFGANRSLSKSWKLLKSLVVIGATLGLTLGIGGVATTGLFPTLFTSDQVVIKEMHSVLLQFSLGLVVTPCILAFEGTLLAGRDLRFLSLTLSGSFALGSLLLVVARHRGYGLAGCWYIMVIFQWIRFFLTLQRLLSPNGILSSNDFSSVELKKLQAVQ